MSVVDLVEGTIVPRVRMGLPVQCDRCSEAIDRGDTVTLYASDTDYGPQGRDEFAINRMYGACCGRTRIQFPCESAVEALFQAGLDEQWRYRDVSLIDRSTSGDGVPWDPPNMWKLLAGISTEEYLDAPETKNMTLGPEDVYDTLDLVGQDVSELVNDAGELTVTEDELQAARDRVADGFREQATEVLRNTDH